MACEVAETKYFYGPKDTTTSTVLPFKHNYIHDLESIWWLGMFTILRHTVDGEPPYPYPISQHFSEFMTLFPTTPVDPRIRRSAFFDMSTVWSSTPPAFSQFTKALMNIHQLLLKSYSAAERYLKDEAPRIDTAAFKDLHIEVRKLMITANTPPWISTAQLLTEVMKKVHLVMKEAKDRMKAEKEVEVKARMEEMLRERERERAERVATKSAAMDMTRRLREVSLDERAKGDGNSP